MKLTEDNIYLMPGELVITSGSKTISTILGSCISFIFYHKNSGLCGMTHAQLPISDKINAPFLNYNTSNEQITEIVEYENKYVNYSTNGLINLFKNKNIKPDEIDIYLFGGSHIVYNQHSMFNVGQENIDIAKKLLDLHKLSVKIQDTGGEKGRKIIFHPENGEYELTYLSNSITDF